MHGHRILIHNLILVIVTDAHSYVSLVWPEEECAAASLSKHDIFYDAERQAEYDEHQPEEVRPRARLRDLIEWFAVPLLPYEAGFQHPLSPVGPLPPIFLRLNTRIAHPVTTGPCRTGWRPQDVGVRPWLSVRVASVICSLLGLMHVDHEAAAENSHNT